MNFYKDLLSDRKNTDLKQTVNEDLITIKKDYIIAFEKVGVVVRGIDELEKISGSKNAY